MTIEQLREAYNHQPFRPFTIHLADGRSILLPSREMIMSAPNGRTIVVCVGEDRFNIIDLLLVTDLEFQLVETRSKGKRR
ncbi:MAG: hypothetical protein ACR2FY_14085 [Pirellulaceae bacterium]